MVAFEQEILRAGGNLNPETVELISHQIESIWHFVYWWAGVSVTVTLFLAGWILKVVLDLRKKVNHDWIEKKIQVELLDVLKEIKDALIGDFKNKGLLTKHGELDERVSKIEDKIEY